MLLGCASYILSQNTPGENFLRPPVSNGTTNTTATHTPTAHNVPSTSTTTHYPIQTTKCVVKGEWFQKCVNAKEAIKWNEQYKRTDHCFRYGLCLPKGNKCEWKQTKEMTDCIEDMKKSNNKIISE